MFKINGDFGHPNGFNMMIMQSQEDTDKLIKAFENAINAGYNPNVVQDEIYRKVGVSPSDLTPEDRYRLTRKVESIYKARYNGGYNGRFN